MNDDDEDDDAWAAAFDSDSSEEAAGPVAAPKTKRKRKRKAEAAEVDPAAAPAAAPAPAAKTKGKRQQRPLVVRPVSEGSDVLTHLLMVGGKAVGADKVVYDFRRALSQIIVRAVQNFQHIWKEPKLPVQGSLMIMEGATLVFDACVLYVMASTFAHMAAAIADVWLLLSPPDAGECFRSDFVQGQVSADETWCRTLPKYTPKKALIGQSTLLDSSTIVIAVAFLILQAGCVVDISLWGATLIFSGGSGLKVCKTAFAVLRDRLQPIINNIRAGRAVSITASDLRRVTLLCENAGVIMRSPSSDEEEKVNVNQFCVHAFRWILQKPSVDARNWQAITLTPSLSVYTATILTLVLVYVMAADRQEYSVRRHFGSGSSMDAVYRLLIGKGASELY
jgi:hypothetical protein